MKKEYIYHVQLVNPYQNDYNWYFGSISSIYALLDKELIGVSQSSLYAHQQRQLDTLWTYNNQFCTIRKKDLIRKKQIQK